MASCSKLASVPKKRNRDSRRWRGIADPPELVRPERAAARDLEQRGGVGEVVAELADLRVEHAVPALVHDADGAHARRVRLPGAEHPADGVRRVQQRRDSWRWPSSSRRRCIGRRRRSPRSMSWT